jgi:hypothetical protein
MNSTTKHCQYIIKKGVRKGLFCITKKCGDDGLCKTHSKSKNEGERFVPPQQNIENIIIKKNKLNILDLPIDILENLIVQNISKGLNIIFNNKIEKYIKYNGSDYYTTFECGGRHCGETHKLKIGYGWWNDYVSHNRPFKLQLLCGSCIKQEIECGCCKKEFNIKKMNYFFYHDNKDNSYNNKNIRCNRCIKDQIKYQRILSIKKYDEVIQYKSLKYKLIDEQIKYKNN